MIVELACGCGKKVLATYRDAGGEVTCGCGQKVDVPRLSQLRKLAKDEGQPAPSLALTQRQLIGRYILGTMFALWMLDTLYVRFFVKVQYPLPLILSLIPLGLSAALMVFTVLGRLWARLILILLLLVALIPIVIVLQDGYRLDLAGQLLIGCTLLLALLFIKT
jgi:hypothetical protein